MMGIRSDTVHITPCINVFRFIHSRMDGVLPCGANEGWEAVRSTEADFQQSRLFLQVSGTWYICTYLPYIVNLPTTMIDNLALSHHFILLINNANGSSMRCDTVDFIFTILFTKSTKHSPSGYSLRFVNYVTPWTFWEHQLSPEMI